ncbi:MAG: hypothetical protein OXO52_12860 [Rhodospirillales bacterium]|nr:hypothetical protein [Rhodospirillales bacterium]MDE0379945.1 hypothetical protein [Rhodospirillales bacterium]
MSTDRRKGEPAPPGAGKRPEREARLAAALRENLRRRKRQKHERKAAAPPPERDGGDA